MRRLGLVAAVWVFAAATIFWAGLFMPVGQAHQTVFDREIEYWFGSYADQAKHIMLCESNGNPLAEGDNGDSLGLFQMNHHWEYAGYQKVAWGKGANTLLFNPTHNIWLASLWFHQRGEIWSGKGGWHRCATDLGFA